MPVKRCNRYTVTVLALVLAGCSGSLLESKKIDYQSARQVRPLEIPPDLTAPSRDNRYAVPDVSPKGVATYSAYTADRAAQPAAGTTPAVLSPAGDGKMRIERAGNQRWLVLNGKPEDLWVTVKDFWLENGFILNIERPEIGVMETDWAENRAKLPQDFIRSTLGKVLDSLYSTGERDKFRTRLEAGQEPGTVEIYISHRGMVEVYANEAKDSTVWQPREPDPELEAEMLSRLMMRFGADESRARAIVNATPQAERATLNQSAGGTTLVLDESFDRAWRRVGLALDRTGFTVEDRNRSEGVYYVRYVDADRDTSKKDEGFLSKLAFWRSDSNKAPVPDGNRYRINVAAQGERSQVRVLTAEGGEDRSETAGRILRVLHQQLR